MRHIEFTNQFKKDLKRARKRNLQDTAKKTLNPSKYLLCLEQVLIPIYSKWLQIIW